MYKNHINYVPLWLSIVFKKSVFVMFTVPILVNSAVRVLFQHEGFEMDPLVEHVRGVEVLPDGLKIIHPGFYYVYSSIHFRPESPRPCKDFQYQVQKYCHRL